MNKSQILAIPNDFPVQLFGRDPVEAKNQLRALRSEWHPRADGVGDTAVFEKVTLLYRNYVRFGPGIIEFDTGSRAFQLKYKRSFETNTCRTYLSDTVYAEKYATSNLDLHKTAVVRIKALKFKDKNVEAECARYVPEHLRDFTLHDDNAVLVCNKLPGYIRLRDVLTHFNGKVPVRHVAWILSCLYNLNCYLSLIANVMHGDVSLDSYYVQPSAHAGALLGGWAFAERLGGRIRALPARSVGLGIGPGQASSRGTALQIRALGLELLGATTMSGASLLTDASIPRPILFWLRGVPAIKHDPVDEYSKWSETLTAAFGRRKFVTLALTSEQLYG